MGGKEIELKKKKKKGMKESKVRKVRRTEGREKKRKGVTWSAVPADDYFVCLAVI